MKTALFGIAIILVCSLASAGPPKYTSPKYPSPSRAFGPIPQTRYYSPTFTKTYFRGGTTAKYYK